METEMAKVIQVVDQTVMATEMVVTQAADQMATETATQVADQTPIVHSIRRTRMARQTHNKTIQTTATTTIVPRDRKANICLRPGRMIQECHPQTHIFRQAMETIDL